MHTISQLGEAKAEAWMVVTSGEDEITERCIESKVGADGRNLEKKTEK